VETSRDPRWQEEQRMSPKRIDVHHHILTPEYVEELAKVGVVEAGGHVLFLCGTLALVQTLL
jgi:hypothetical protein